MYNVQIFCVQYSYFKICSEAQKSHIYVVILGGVHTKSKNYSIYMLCMQSFVSNYYCQNKFLKS